MTNTKLEQLTKAIQEAVPEIMELKFGCKVKYVGVYYIYLRTKDNHYTFKCDLTDTIMSFTKKCFDEEFEIIGRPITLEDCLIAVSKKQGEWGIRFWGNGVIRIDENITWKPNKPLHQQEQETIELLWNLICNK